MTTNTSSTAEQTTVTTETVLGSLTPENNNLITEKQVKLEVEAAALIIVGICRGLINPADAESQALGEGLRDVNITLDDARNLGALAETTIEYMKERDTRDAAARASSTKFEAVLDKLHNEIQAYGSILRGQFGKKSSVLESFGIKKAGGAHPGPRKKAEAKKDDAKKAEAQKTDDTQDATKPESPTK
jgi:hypothetical protein